MMIILELVLKWAVPFVCGGVITGLIARVKLLKAKNSALEDGVQCLLRAEIIRSHEKYFERGWCPVYAHEALGRVYSAYHKLGGNDVATKLYKEVMELPVKDGKEDA